MAARRFPVLFVSHGSPTIVVDQCAAADYLRSLGPQLLAPPAAQPQGIVVVSAHHPSPAGVVRVTGATDTIHDFGGFARELYEMTYDAPADPTASQRIVDQLNAALARDCASSDRDGGWGLGGGRALRAELDMRRGLDHGAWTPLRLMHPAADLPVIQVSLPANLAGAALLDLGRALAPLRATHLILCSGAVTHDLPSLFSRPGGLPPIDSRPAAYVCLAFSIRRLFGLFLLLLDTPLSFLSPDTPTDSLFLASVSLCFPITNRPLSLPTGWPRQFPPATGRRWPSIAAARRMPGATIRTSRTSIRCWWRPAPPTAAPGAWSTTPPPTSCCAWTATSLRIRRTMRPRRIDCVVALCHSHCEHNKC